MGRVPRLGAQSAVVAAAAAGVAAQGAQRPVDPIAVRVQALEDREAIRALLANYAITLDNRDFAGFGRLWAKDSEFRGVSIRSRVRRGCATRV